MVRLPALPPGVSLLMGMTVVVPGRSNLIIVKKLAKAERHQSRLAALFLAVTI